MQFGFALPGNFSRAAQLYASIIRLNMVLQAEELKKTDEETTEKPSVLLKDASFSLSKKDILKGISLNVTKNGLTVVTGPVGSGKSSLLKVILQDFHPVSEGEFELSLFLSWFNFLFRNSRSVWQYFVCFSRPMAISSDNPTKHFVWRNL